MTDVLKVGRTCWRVEKADRFAVIIDAEQYFLAARDAMLQARKSIMLVGWDFDARIHLARADDKERAPLKLGDFVLWLVKHRPELEIRLLQWNSGTIRNLFRGANAWHFLRWKMHPRITARMDSVHPPIAAHHQKLLAVDDSIAFCGGIDMTTHRWDTRAHADVEPGRVSPWGAQLPPWHDLSSMFDGEAARAIGDLCRLRWTRACGEILPQVQGAAVTWPQNVPPLAGPVQIGIARTSPEMPGYEPLREIEAMHVEMIEQAQTLIYAENPYFASRKVAQALARRLEEPNGPEVVIVNPMQSGGWLEGLAMDTARARLMAALAPHDRHGRLGLFYPVTAKEKPIYVHGKLMIVDDRVLRIGSANFNNRSMRLDTECDVVLDADQDASGTLTRTVRDLRNNLLAEHLGTTQEQVAGTYADHGSMLAAVRSLQGRGRSLVRYEIPDLSALQVWLADNEILDPEGPEEFFEPLAKRGLFRGRLRKPAP